MRARQIRNFIIAFLIILAAYVLQYCVLDNISFLSCTPNLLMIITFMYGYSSGKVSGMFAGFFSGLLIDVFFCDVLGFNALIFLLIGFLGGVWSKYFFSDNPALPMLLLLADNFIYRLIYYVIWFVFKSRFIFGYLLVYSIIPECILTVIAGLILYIPILRLNSSLSIDES